MSGFEDSPFVESAGQLWEEATKAAFLDAIAAGNLPRESFERWLAQDYHFARGLMVFQSLAVARCPRDCQGPLIAGLVALDSELKWFESQAGKRRLDLDVELHPTCRRYTDFLIRTAYTETSPVLLGTLFGVEVSYYAAWSALDPAGPYAEFIERWSNAAFRDYVQELRKMAERTRTGRSQEYFNEVLKQERDFWAMSFGG